MDKRYMKCGSTNFKVGGMLIIIQPKLNYEQDRMKMGQDIITMGSAQNEEKYPQCIHAY